MLTENDFILLQKRQMLPCWKFVELTKQLVLFWEKKRFSYSVIKYKKVILEQWHHF